MLRFRWWLGIAAAVFTVGIILGLLTAPQSGGFISEEITALERLSSLIAPFKITTVLFLFLKNTLAILLSFAFSPLFCLMPLLTLLLNGWILAAAASIIVAEESLGFLLGGIMPHGIIEIPALFIGTAAGFSFGAAILTALFRKEKRSLLPATLLQNLKYLALAVALLLPAAIIETYVTPLLIS